MEQVILGAIAAAVWVYLIAFRGRFWRLENTARTGAPVPGRSIVAVIPARDEADMIGGAIASLLAQDYAGRLDIVVIDDHSSDGTADIAREAAVKAGAADRVSVIAADAMPGGWTGKLWAVRQGTALAATMSPDYLLLTDADIVHSPDNLRGLVARAENEGYDLVSLMVRLHCRGFWERLMVPAFVFFFFKLYPPRWVADSSREMAAAAGGCMLLRRETLELIGGVDSIRHEIIDDCALARRVKSVGKVWLGVAEETRSVRPYGSWRPLWDMIARCAFAQINYSTGILLSAIVGMAVTYLAPPLLPAIALFYMAATIFSAVQFWRGRGGAWKGRYQAAAP